MNKKERLAALMTKGREALDAAKAATTDADRHKHLAEAKAAADEAKAIRHDLAIEAEGQKLRDEIGDPTDPAAAGTKGTRRGLPITRRGRSGRLVKGIVERMAPADDFGRKALLPSGSVVSNVPMDPEPVNLERAGATLLDALNSLISAPNYRYLRQVSRANNAAVVEPGGLKPTSEMGLDSIEDHLRVVAHLSEPIFVYDLSDNAAIQTFVEDELLDGLRLAIESQVIGGDGIGENFTGLLETEGTQSQAFSSSAIETIRKAITKLEQIGLSAGLVAVSPTVWESIELSRESGTGALELGSPVDRARRQLWSTQVIPTPAVPEGVGLVIDTSSVTVRHDGVIDVRWGTTGDDFETNRCRARVETRANVAVQRPMGVVVADLTDTP